MMAMANEAPTPNWRNFAAWGAAGAIPYFVAVWGSASLLHQDVASAVIQSSAAAAFVGLGLIVAMAAAGFTSRNRPFSLRNFRNFAIRDAVVVAVLLLAIWGFSAASRAGALGAMGASDRVAAGTGSVLVVFALLGGLVLASAHTRVDVIDNEMAADDLRERGRLMLCSFAWMVACGLLLILMSLAGPGGLLSPAAALAGALLLIAVLAMLGIAAWRLADELGRTLSHETGNMAYYLIILLGGGWAILAHLGFVAGPAPIDWLTLFTLLIFAAAIIAVGRRKLLAP